MNASVGLPLSASQLAFHTVPSSQSFALIIYFPHFTGSQVFPFMTIGYCTRQPDTGKIDVALTCADKDELDRQLLFKIETNRRNTQSMKRINDRWRMAQVTKKPATKTIEQFIGFCFGEDAVRHANLEVPWAVARPASVNHYPDFGFIGPSLLRFGDLLVFPESPKMERPNNLPGWYIESCEEAEEFARSRSAWEDSDSDDDDLTTVPRSADGSASEALSNASDDASEPVTDASDDEGSSEAAKALLSLQTTCQSLLAVINEEDVDDTFALAPTPKRSRSRAQSPPMGCPQSLLREIFLESDPAGLSVVSASVVEMLNISPIQMQANATAGLEAVERAARTVVATGTPIQFDLGELMTWK